MRTAALLPTPGDPALARYWIRNYEQTWKGEVDELLVLVNGNPDGASLYREAGARVETVGHRMGHGEAIGQLVAATDADRVVLVEDDAFVRQPGVIRERLVQLEGVIGCPRGGMDPAIAQAATARWGTVVGPDGSTGHGLWPCFLFARTADLRRVTTGFASRTWHDGQVIPGLGFRVEGDMTTDTMTSAAFELRAMTTITPDVQYKELWQKDCRGDEPWFHAGGLSNDPAAGRPDIGMDNLEGIDWAHRFWWWRRIGLDYSADAARMKVDPDYWNDRLEPWITWHD